MAREPVSFVWELGIDWNAIQTGGVGYLRGGLLQDGIPSPGTNPVIPDDTITFRIFDVTSPVPSTAPLEGCVTEIVSFGIDSQAAVKDQPPEIPLNKTHPEIVSSSTESGQSPLFENAFCSWDLEQVKVRNISGRFLLTVYLQARGPGGVIRLFNHDPEMVVGEN